jgi:DNA-binding NarL/FixJ family response regulator
MDEPIRLIIADDHPLFRKGLRDAIESDPSLTLVGEASNGAVALELIDRLDPAMAILDVDMGAMGGLEVAREIRRRKPETDIIFLTMYKEEDLFNEAMDLGARAYVLKDSAVNDILEAVHAVAGGRYYISSGVSDQLIRRSARVQHLLRQTPSLEDLTPAELRVLRMIAENMTSKEVAERLSISHKTVENHRTNIAAKLHLRGSHSLLKFALENRRTLAGK